MYSALAVVSPPQAEPVTLDLLRRHIRVDTIDEDDLLALYLATARATAEQFLGRALVTQTLRWVMADAPPANSFPLYPFTAFILPLWLPYSALFQHPVELPRSPVQSIVSVSTGRWGQADAPLDPSQYQVDGDTEPSRLKLLGSAGACPSDHTIVEFVAGYASPDAIPRPIVQAILLMAGFLYENRGDAGGEMPAVAKALLWPYRLYTFG